MDSHGAAGAAAPMKIHEYRTVLPRGAHSAIVRDIVRVGAGRAEPFSPSYRGALLIDVRSNQNGSRLFRPLTENCDEDRLTALSQEPSSRIRASRCEPFSPLLVLHPAGGGTEISAGLAICEASHNTLSHRNYQVGLRHKARSFEEVRHVNRHVPRQAAIRQRVVHDTATVPARR